MRNHRPDSNPERRIKLSYLKSRRAFAPLISFHPPFFGSTIPVAQRTASPARNMRAASNPANDIHVDSGQVPAVLMLPIGSRYSHHAQASTLLRKSFSPWCFSLLPLKKSSKARKYYGNRHRGVRLNDIAARLLPHGRANIRVKQPSQPNSRTQQHDQQN